MTNKAIVRKTTFAMPDDVSDWLKKMAAHNVTSQTAEIVRVVRDRMNQGSPRRAFVQRNP
jgi:hypothetical protein